MARARKESDSEGRQPVSPVNRNHHHVYVVFLRNPKGDGKAGYYVGMTGLTPEQRFANHKAGIKSASVVRKYGVRLVPTRPRLRCRYPCSTSRPSRSKRGCVNASTAPRRRKR